MKDWRKTIDNYLWMTRRDILTVQENVTHQHALEKAHLEYEKYKRNQEYILSPVECHFFESIGELDKLDGKNNQQDADEWFPLRGNYTFCHYYPPATL